MNAYGKNMDDDDYGIAPVDGQQGVLFVGQVCWSVPGAPIKGHDNAAFAESKNKNLDSGGD
jgi:hypothetical protein